MRILSLLILVVFYATYQSCDGPVPVEQTLPVATSTTQDTLALARLHG